MDIFPGDRQQNTRARQRQELEQHLRERFRHWNFPTQEALENLLRTHGPEAALLAVTAVELSHYPSSQAQRPVESPPGEV